MPADCGKITFTRRHIAIAAYKNARKFGVSRRYSMMVALHCARRVQVRARHDG